MVVINKSEQLNKVIAALRYTMNGLDTIIVDKLVENPEILDSAKTLSLDIEELLRVLDKQGSVKVVAKKEEKAIKAKKVKKEKSTKAKKVKKAKKVEKTTKAKKDKKVKAEKKAKTSKKIKATKKVKTSKAKTSKKVAKKAKSRK